MEEMSDEGIHRPSSEIFGYKRKKSNRALEEASEVGKTFSFLSPKE